MTGPIWQRLLLATGAVVLVAACLSTSAQACPGCAEAQAGQGAERAAIVSGYFWSIIFMMSMPFLLLGGFGTYCYLQVRKARAARDAAANASTATPQSKLAPSMIAPAVSTASDPVMPTAG